MGFWAAIKKAVNSDLSTPLNTQLSGAEIRLGDSLTGLNTNVSSRAPSSTALSVAQWTNARAGYLDNLNKSPFAAGSVVRSVQRGTGTLNPYSSSTASETISISSVTPAKCAVTLNGGGYGNAPLDLCVVSSLSSTGLTIKIPNSSAVNTLILFSWQVVEFY